MDFDKVIDRTGSHCAKYDEGNDKWGDDLIHCGVADMDFVSPKPILDAMEEVVRRGVFGYTNLPGNYQTLVKEWMWSQYACPIEEDWVVFSPRINMALNMMVEALSGEGDKVLVHTPAYPALTNAVTGYGRKLVQSPLVHDGSKWRMDMGQMEREMDSSMKMILLSNPHNPTGRVWSREELGGLVRLCLKHGLLLVTDDIHSDLVRVKGAYQPIFNVSEEIKGQSIICNSITKTFNVPGVILSNMIIPDEGLRRKMKDQIHRWGLHNPNIFAASILEPAYRECLPWLERVKEYLWENQDVLCRFVRERLPFLDVAKPEATYLSWIGFRETGYSDADMEELLYRKAKVGAYMGKRFGAAGSGYFRINVATPRKRLEEILLRLEKGFKDF